MAQPRTVNKKYDRSKVSSYSRIHPKTLNATPSKRTVDLALPKKSAAIATKKLVTGNEAITATINNLLSRIRKSRYQKYRLLCNALAEQAAARRAKQRKKLHKALTKPEDWERHNRVLERIAGPKIVPEPPPPNRGRKVSLEDLKERMEFLSTPPIKDIPEQTRDPFKVAPSALTYRISKRVKELAYRKNPPEILPPKNLEEVSPAAKTAVASPRLIEMAKPMVRPAGVETDLKEDAFSVSPRALKARCTKRVKLLARPKNYGQAK